MTDTELSPGRMLEPLTPHQQWLEDRRNGIGGSDAAAAVGMSRWMTPLMLWLDKRGELERSPENEPMRWGTILEPVVRQEYANRTGRVVVVPGKILQHPRRTFAILNADGIADEQRLYEGKTARTAEGWGEEGSADIPMEYVLQVQHGMFVTGLAVADVAVLIGGQDFRIYEVPADAELQEMLMDQEADFWRHVQEGIPPDVVNRDDVKRRWRVSTGRSVQATPEVFAASLQLAQVKAALAHHTERKEELEARIQSYMEDACELVRDGVTLATWRNINAAPKFDADQFREEHPDLWKTYLREPRPSRRFYLKTKASGT